MAGLLRLDEAVRELVHDGGFLGAAQIDRHGNLNSTVIGDYERPKVRLPGGGGAPEIAAMAKEVIVIIRQSQRTFVDRIHSGRGEPRRCADGHPAGRAPHQRAGRDRHRLCGSGMEAAVGANRAIAVGDASICIAGGVESMSRAPWVVMKPEQAYARVDQTLVSTTLGWRLVNPQMPKGWTVSLGEGAEILADRYEIAREAQDEFALRSHGRAAAAWERGAYAEETVAVPDVELERDEPIRPDSSLEKLAALRPAFRPEGTVTAGNASPLNDGAAALLLAVEMTGREPLARIVSRGLHPVDPPLYGIAPVEAANRALERAGIGWGDLELVELNEAFAAQALACLSQWPELNPEIVNVNGGGVALGHPIGCSGASHGAEAAMGSRLSASRRPGHSDGGRGLSVKLHNRLDGTDDAPVLMLSNSLGTDLGMWDDALPWLMDRFRVLRYDQRGHGCSPAPPGPYTMADLAGDALDLLDRLGLERVSFCGVSLGGMTGMWLAVNAPDRLERVALCCTSAYLPPRENWTERAATVRARGMEAVVDAALERWFTPALAECRPDAVERTRRALLNVSAEGYAGCCEAIAAHDLRAEVGSIRVPTLVLAAADDPATPPEHGRLIAEAVEGALSVVLERGRHLVAVEQPDDFARAVLAHLTE